MNRIAVHISIGLSLAFMVGGCGNSSYEARQRASEERMVASAQQVAGKLKADGEAQIADYDRRVETWKPQLKRYVACNRNASEVVATQVGDPASLALAARSMCRSEEAKLQSAIYAAYADNPKFGMDTLERIRKKGLETNVGDIVAYRVKFGAAPGQRRPPQPPAADRKI